MRKRSSIWLAGVCAMAMALVGCTDRSDAPEPSKPAPLISENGAAADPPTPDATYRAWLDAIAAEDPAATCARHDPSLTIALRQEAILLKRARLGDPCVDFVAVLWDTPDVPNATETDPLGIEVTQETVDRAILAVDFPGRDQTVTLNRSADNWYVVGSEDRSVAGDADPSRWVANWCDLELGMSPEEVAQVMGEPSGEYTVANGGEPQLFWARFEYDFRAYLDPVSGEVVDLVGDYDRLPASDLEQLDCPELR